MSANSEIDLTLALQLQAQFEEELRVLRVKEEETIQQLSKKAFKWNAKNRELPEPVQDKLSVPLVDPSWELLDPNPDIHSLFLTFNSQFFWGRLSGIEVKWSPKMTLCAGVCSYDGRGGLCSVRLSQPLLKLRPRKDLVETLLHEMIHAYLFVTHNNTDHDGHGPNFHSHMHRINNLAGTKISVYHSFHDEVDVYRQHIWQCDGPCRHRRPFFGLVKRSMNRAPSPRDFWWSRHQQECGGTYSKIQEPEGYGVKRKRTTDKENTSKKNAQDIRKFFSPNSSKGIKSASGSKTSSNAKTAKIPVLGASQSNVNGFASGSVTPHSDKGQTCSSGRSKLDDEKDGKNKEISVSSQLFKAFSGSGRTLGGPEGNGVSRLLSKTGSSEIPSSSFQSSNTQSKIERKSDNKKPNLKSKSSQQLPFIKYTNNSLVPGSSSRSTPSTSQTQLSSSKILSGEEKNSRLSDGILPSSSQDLSNLDDSVVILDDHDLAAEKLFPCPICNKKFSPILIDTHAESHFL